MNQRFKEIAALDDSEIRRCCIDGGGISLGACGDKQRQNWQIPRCFGVAEHAALLQMVKVDVIIAGGHAAIQIRDRLFLLVPGLVIG